ncbi:MAG: histone deacetylase family protein [Candidatus Nitrospinota bacterium M3_3B_026]
MGGTAIFYDPVFLKHDTGAHPETPARLEAIVERLKSAPFASSLEWVLPPRATLEQLALIHTPEYIRSVEQSARSGQRHLDMDTVICPESWEAALAAAGAAVGGVRNVVEGKHKNAFLAVRPPGHHAEADRAMGFCLFNNAAIGARFAREELGVPRVAIVDFDIHHGNGTQNAFYSDPTVFYISTHQWPLYPGTGSESERGEGEAEGTTMNFPLSPGAGDADVLGIFDDVIIPTLKKFAPGLIVISAGFDAHRDDPLGSLELTEEGFGGMAGRLLDLADDLGHGRVMAVLEGGYNLAALAGSTAAVVERMSQAAERG